MINSVFLVQFIKSLYILLEISSFGFAQICADVSGKHFTTLPCDPI